MLTVLSVTFSDWLPADKADSDVSKSFPTSQDNNFQMLPLIRNLVKCVIIGDGRNGKTSLLFTYCLDELPKDYVPVVFDNYTMTVPFAGETYNLQLWDTGGPHCDPDYYDRLRPLSYPGTSIFLVCFSVTKPASFRRVEGMWVPEIKHHCPNTPFLLVGTKVDLRVDRATLDKLNEKQEKAVSKEEGEILAKSLKAATYVECSALTREGVKNVFDQAIFHQLEDNQQQKMSEKKKCNLF